MATAFESFRNVAHERLAASLGRPVGPPPDQDPAYTQPVGDPGLLGPRSPAWTVHSDFPAMLTGGIASLFLQALHPGAMAGVHDHSDYAHDPTGRLQRTGRFVAVTTFGSTPAAHRAIDAVKAVHGRVVGTRPDGLPYAANDPDLLRWVHIAEVWCFLRGYQRYGPRRLGQTERDRYFDDISVVAELLGATNVPRSERAANEYLASMRPHLAVSEQTLAVRRFLLAGAATDRVSQFGYGMIVQASIGLLPRWAREMLGLRAPARVQLGAVRPTLAVLFPALRLSLGAPVVREAALARATSAAAAIAAQTRESAEATG